MTTPGLSVRRRVATVAAIDQTTTPPTCTVTWPDGVTQTAGLTYLASYQPAISDLAVVDLTAGAPLLIGVAGTRRVEARLRRAANQSIPNAGAGPTTIQWDTEDADPYAFIAITSDTITIPAGLGGLYAISVRDTGNFGGARNFGNLTITSSITGNSGVFRALPDPVTGGFVVVGITLPLAAGDTVTFGIYQSSGAAANHTAWINVVRVGP